MSNLPEKFMNETGHLTHKVVEKTAQYQDAYTTVNHLMESFWQRVPYICIGIIVFFIFWVFSKLFKYFLRKTLLQRTPQQQNLVLVLYRVGSIIILFVGFLIALVIIIPSFTPAQLVGSLGIGSVAIGFAFKDIFQNLLSGILILLGEPFKIGDYIHVNGLEGTVEDIQIRATHLRSNDGKRIVIPNATVYISPVTVSTAYHQHRCELGFDLHYNQLDTAKSLILEQLKQHEIVLKEPAPQIHTQISPDFSVAMNAIWWINTEQIAIQQALNEIQQVIKISAEQHNIELSFPIQQHEMAQENIQQHT